MRKPETAGDTDGIPLAIALEYDGTGAPRVTAKGMGRIAEEIVALAQAHHVPMTEDRALARLLSTLELDEEIPEALYRVVAEVLAFAYMLRDREVINSGDGAAEPGRPPRR